MYSYSRLKAVQCVKIISMIFRVFPYSSKTLTVIESPIWLMVQVAPIRDEREQVKLLMLTFTDISHIKSALLDEDSKGSLSTLLVPLQRDKLEGGGELFHSNKRQKVCL